MARPEKKGLNYFPLDVGVFSANSDLKPLIRRFGAEGFAIAIHIYCDVYSNGYYLKVNDLQDYYYELADDCKVTIEKVQLISTFMQSRTLLRAFSSDKNTVLTSHGIQKRYAEAMKSRKKSVAQYKGDFWLLSDEEEKELENDTSCKSAQNANLSEKNPSYSEKNPSNSEIYDTNKIKENKIKENEIKGNNSSFNHPSYNPPSLEEVKKYFDERERSDLADKFFNHYEQMHWMLYGVPVQHWKAIADQWLKNESELKQKNDAKIITERAPLADLVEQATRRYRM